MNADSTAIDYREFPVLYVDDEVENLRTFELAFRREFSVVRATSGSEALNVLALSPVAVVLSDHRMPGMTGTELLARVREVAPRTVRLLVTAYGDASTLSQAINQGCIYRYIPKPWDIGEMREIVKQAIQLYALEEHRGRLVDELSTLHLTNRQIAKHLECGPLADSVVRAVVDEFGFDGAALFTSAADGSRVRVRSSYPELLEDRSSTAEISMGDLSSLGSAPVLLDLPHAIEGGNDVARFASVVAAEEMLVVPLKGRFGLVGVLTVDNRRGGRRFGALETQLLESLGAHIATCIDNAQLVGQLRNEAARTSGSDLLAISGALGASLVREVQVPLMTGKDMTEIAAARCCLEDVSERVAVFAEILREQTLEWCELNDRLRVALETVRSLAERESVGIEVVEADLPKLQALPGPLLQCLVHLLELAIERCAGGSLEIAGTATGDQVGLVIKLAPQVARDDDAELDAAQSLRLAACEGLARELQATIELAPIGSATTWRLMLPTNAIPG